MPSSWCGFAVCCHLLISFLPLLMKYEVLTHKNSFKKTWFHPFGNRSQVQHTSTYKHVDLPAETELAYFWRCIYHRIYEWCANQINTKFWSLKSPPKAKNKIKITYFSRKNISETVVACQKMNISHSTRNALIPHSHLLKAYLHGNIK